MEKWIIIGSGGFVEGSVLPYIDKSVKGIITHNPIKSVGLSKAYGIKLYSDLKEAKKDGCDTAYICSSSWTHLDWIKKGLDTGLKVICEKPIITDRDDLDQLKKLAEKEWYGSMIKRAHPLLKKMINKEVINHFFKQRMRSLNH